MDLFSAINASSYKAPSNSRLLDGCTADGVPDTDVFDRDNTGSGTEQVRIDVFDGAGTVIYTVTFSNALATYAAGLIDTTAYSTAPQYNPITVVVTSLAGNDLPEVSTVIGTGSCAGLPTYGNACIALTPDAVVGDMPFSTQAYYAPGKAANGVVLNPGTYWVLGEDESGEYYKIVLSCQYLWVPVNSMQPSFQAPWSGQPLPMTVVD